MIFSDLIDLKPLIPWSKRIWLGTCLPKVLGRGSSQVTEFKGRCVFTGEILQGCGERNEGSRLQGAFCTHQSSFPQLITTHHAEVERESLLGSTSQESHQSEGLASLDAERRVGSCSRLSGDGPPR